MANIIKNIRGFVCDEREKNWAKEFFSLIFKTHQTNKTLDHPDLSVTTKKLADNCVTEEKLSDDVLGTLENLSTSIKENFDGLSANISALGISHTSDIQSIREDINLKANKSTTLSGYGITNCYTKAQTDFKLDSKVDFSVFSEELDKKADINDFIINIEIDGNGNITADKQFDDLQTAYLLAKTITLRGTSQMEGINNFVISSYAFQHGICYFSGCMGSTNLLLICNNDGWSFYASNFVKDEEFAVNIGNINTALEKISNMQDVLIGGEYI